MHRARLFARRALAIVALAGAGLGPVGCSADALAAANPAKVDAGADADAGTSGGWGGGAGAACPDGQILAILAAEFAARVDIASSVRPGLESPSALDLAQKILTDDSVLQVQVQGEARETGIAVTPGGIDRGIAAEAQGSIEALAAEVAPALDASYVDREVLAHARALGLIDRLLAPSVHDPRIADLIARVRDVVTQHAQAASQAQSVLEGACASLSAAD